MTVTRSGTAQGNEGGGENPPAAGSGTTQGSSQTAGGTPPADDQQQQTTSGGQSGGQPGTSSSTSVHPTSGGATPPPAAPVQVQVQLPPLTAKLAQEIHKIPLNEQRSHAAQLYSFLVQGNVDLSYLNNPSNPTTTCMVNLPDSNMICIVHSLGFGTNPIGQVSPIATRLLTLTRDGSALNPPQALILPQEIASPLEIQIPTDNEFNTKILTSTQFRLFKNTDVNARVTVPKIMPIITFLVYDGFEQDLDAVTVYKEYKTYIINMNPMYK